MLILALNKHNLSVMNSNPIDSDVNQDAGTEHTGSKRKMVQGMLMALEGYLNETNEKVNEALSLSDIGEKTDLFKNIEGIIDNPLKSMAKGSESLSDAIEGIKVSLLKKYARSENQLLDFLAYSAEGQATHFFIGLSNDTPEHRDVFYALLNEYENYTLSDSHPMIFHFVTKDLLSDVFDVKYIELDEQAS